MGEDHSWQGEIVEQMPDGIVLIQFDHNCGMPASLTAVRIELMVQSDNLDDEGCYIFTNRDALDAFNEWLDSAPSVDKSDGAALN